MFDNMKLGLVILLTGIVVVFSVLVLLILIIKLYSTGVSNAQSTIEKKKVEKASTEEDSKKTSSDDITEVSTAAENVQTASIEKTEDNDTIPGEIIAAIAAAVEVIFGEGAVEVKSVKKARQPGVSSRRRSAWKAAGMAENTRAF